MIAHTIALWFKNVGEVGSDFASRATGRQNVGRKKKRCQALLAILPTGTLRFVERYRGVQHSQVHTPDVT